MNNQRLPIGPDGGDRSPWIATGSGGKFRPLSPRAADVEIEDIARGLSRRVRFSGQTRKGIVYTVAEHSREVASRFKVTDHHGFNLAMWGLLHDAAEAWLPDVASPIKPYVFMSVPEGESYAMRPFAAVEERILREVSIRFGLTWPIPPKVFVEDRRELARERRDLIEDQAEVWESLKGVEPRPEPVVVMGNSQQIERLFLEAFFQLTRERRELRKKGDK